jgi:DNA-binding SARP family transcriptional activator
MRYEILGPVRVISGDRSAPINARKIQVLLVSLLSSANRFVSTDQIIADIWGHRIPRRALAGVYVYISQLRKTLDRIAASDLGILTGPEGYLLRTQEGDLDSDSFLRKVEAGRAYTKEGCYELAASSFDDALGHWRGPLSWGRDCGPNVEAFEAYLTETRLESLEMLIEARLDLGCHRELAGQLYTLVAEHPLRETFWRQLILALYRSDCKADALRTYASARRILLDELGLEPCRSLQRLHLGILADDEQLLMRRESAKSLAR